MSDTFARIDSGKVTEIISIKAGEPDLLSRYHAAIVERFVPLHGVEQNIVKPGWNYDGTGFSNPQPPALQPIKRYVKVSTIRERLEAVDKWENMVEILQSNQPVLMKILTLEFGIDPDDMEARSLIALAGADPDEILQ